MATYGDIADLVRAFLDDQPAAWATNDFLVKFINAAQRRLVSDLAARSVERLRYRLHTVIYVPAGVASLSNVMSMAPSNEFAHSDRFSLGVAAATDVWGPYLPGPVGAPSAYSAPPHADPWGTTLASRWTLPVAASGLAMGNLGYTVQSTSPGQYLTGAVWLRTNGTPITIIVAVGDSSLGGGTGPLGEVAANVTSVWQRFAVTYGPYTPHASSQGALFLLSSLGETSGAVIDLVRAKIEYSQFDSGDVLTNGFPATQQPISLPPDMIEPFSLYERRPGGDNSEWRPMIGPRTLTDTVPGTQLRQWDWRGGEITFLGATEDREVRLDYWGRLAEYRDPSDANEMVPLADAQNLLAYRTAAMVAESKGLMDKAAYFHGMAKEETENLVTQDVKATQCIPRRRRPWLGFSRYPATRYPNY